MGDQVFRGRTGDAAAPFIPSEWWTKDKRVVGTVERVFKIEGRNNYGVRLLKPVVLDDEQCDEVSIGASAGLRMALQAARLHELREGDRIVMSCYGETPSKKAGNSPRKDFEIEVTRAEPANGDVPDEYRL
jgi:hypothetical protein